MPDDFLTQMAAQSRQRVALARDEMEFEDLWDSALDAPEPPRLARSQFDLIAEVKASSPSEGVLRPVTSETSVQEAVQQAETYASAGAAAVSVLTEPTRFGGSLEHLRAVAQAVKIPVMRKDFITQDWQVIEARAAGAAGVLLIVRMLSDDDLFEMTDLTRDLGMFCLVEAFDQADLDRLRRLLILRGGEFATGDHVGELLLGLNCRDLSTLALEPARFAQLRSAFPSGYRVVAESGIITPIDAANAARHGYDMALVGSSLMKSNDPRQLAAEMIAAGRLAAGG